MFEKYFLIKIRVREALHIEVASECNERCVHCYIPHEDKLKMIKSSLFYHLIEEGRNMNIVNQTASEGENPYYIKIL